MHNRHNTVSDALNLSTISYRLKKYIKVRWIFLLTLSGAGLITEYISERFSKTLVLNIIVAIGVLYLNALFQYLAKKYSNKINKLRSVAISVILADILASTFLIYNNGGIEARTIIVYAIPIVAAGAFFRRRVVYGLAFLSGFLYDSILIMDYLRVIPRQVINAESIHGAWGSVLVASIFYPATFFMVAFVSDYVLTLLNERELQLRESTKKLNDAQSVANIGSWEWDISDNKIVWSNQLYRIFNLEPSEFTATYKSYLTKVHKADRKLVDDIVSKALRDKLEFNFDHRTNPDENGDFRWVHAEGKVVVDDKNNPIKVMGTAQDITERKKQETELRNRSIELEKLNSIMIGRELKMIDLKSELASLKANKQ